MADDTRQLLLDAAPAPGPAPPFDPLWTRARRRRQLARAGTVVVAAVAVAAAAVLGPGLVASRPPAGNLEIVGEPVGPGWPEVRGGTLRFRLSAVPEGVTPHVIEDRNVFFVRDGRNVDVFLSDAQHAPNEGLWWCPHDELFVSPAHDERFDRAGRWVNGPARRHLDRFAVDVRGNEVLVDAGRVLPGGARSAYPAVGRDPVTGELLPHARSWGEGLCRDHVPGDDPPSLLASGVVPGAAPDGADAEFFQRLSADFWPEGFLDFIGIERSAIVAVPVPGQPDRFVLAAPSAEPPVLFSPACQLLGAVPLPAGWLGYCFGPGELGGERAFELLPWSTDAALGTSEPADPDPPVGVPPPLTALESRVVDALAVLGMPGQRAENPASGSASIWVPTDEGSGVVLTVAVGPIGAATADVVAERDLDGATVATVGYGTGAPTADRFACGDHHVSVRRGDEAPFDDLDEVLRRFIPALACDVPLPEH